MLSTIPPAAGIGLRSPHYQDILQQKPPIAWLETHSENFFGDGGRPQYILSQLRKDYPLSLHGVGLSLGSSDELSAAHLQKLKHLIERFEPALVSEHISWSSIGGHFLNELLPIPYTEESLQHLCQRIEQAQEFLQRQILVENASSYLEFNESTIPEWEFVNAVAEKTGCGILLDVNNIYVNSFNHKFDPDIYLQVINPDVVQEIHLAGHDASHGEVLIDHHGDYVCQAVWDLYKKAIERFSAVPTLIEWDINIPPLDELLGEARKAQHILETHYALAA